MTLRLFPRTREAQSKQLKREDTVSNYMHQFRTHLATALSIDVDRLLVLRFDLDKEVNQVFLFNFILFDLD